MPLRRRKEKRPPSRLSLRGILGGGMGGKCPVALAARYSERDEDPATKMFAFSSCGVCSRPLWLSAHSLVEHVWCAKRCKWSEKWANKFDAQVFFSRTRPKASALINEIFCWLLFIFSHLCVYFVSQSIWMVNLLLVYCIIYTRC